MILIHFFISLFLFLIWIPIYLLGFPLVAIGLLFCREDDEHLPRLFWIFDNPTAGINGTLGGQNPIWPRITNGQNRAYRWRWVWLAWRNPTSGFSHAVGVPITQPVQQTVYHFVTVNRMGPWWDYALRLPYGNGRGFMIRVGWKLSAYKTAKSDEQPPIAQRMFRVSPWAEMA